MQRKEDLGRDEECFDAAIEVREGGFHLIQRVDQYRALGGSVLEEEVLALDVAEYPELFKESLYEGRVVLIAWRKVADTLRL